MPCRVGITTNPQERRAFWESQVHGLRNWRILAKYSTKKEAQDHETRHALSYNCKASGGGRDADGIWHVYKFEFTRSKQS